MKIKILIIVFLLLNIDINAQEQYFKEVLKTITSDEFEGRGYVNEGMKKTSLFLVDELKQLGVKPIDDSFIQTHQFGINIIKNAHLKLNGQNLIYGKDFIVKPSSKSVQKKQNKLNYIFNTKQFIESFESRTKTIEFIKNDEFGQKDKNIILPVLNSKIDSIQKYYKTWSNSYERNNNENLAVFRFVSDSLTASLSQRQANVTEFIIKEKYFSQNLKINDFSVESEFVNNFSFDNVIGSVDGINNDSVVVISAHYDHLGRVGNSIFPGASDNASGTAMLLSLAKYYTENQPKYKTVFMFFGAEEAGIIGSYKYVENPLFPLDKIKFLVNLDIMGAGEDGIQVVNGTKYKKEFDRLVAINNQKQFLKTVKIRGESCNSDHCPFDQKGVPSLFIYTLGGKGNYHNIYDTFENLDLSKSNDVRQLLINFVDGL